MNRKTMHQWLTNSGKKEIKYMNKINKISGRKSKGKEEKYLKCN
jgi:hypothetical protein